MLAIAHSKLNNCAYSNTGNEAMNRSPFKLSEFQYIYIISFSKYFEI